MISIGNEIGKYNTKNTGKFMLKSSNIPQTLYYRTLVGEYQICRVTNESVEVEFDINVDHFMRADIGCELKPIEVAPKPLKEEASEDGEVSSCECALSSGKLPNVEATAKTDNQLCLINCYGENTFCVLIEGNSTIHFLNQRSVQFSFATLMPGSTDRTSLIVEVGSVDLTLCNLVPGKIENANFNFCCAKGKTYEFTILGSGSVHMIGRLDG